MRQPTIPILLLALLCSVAYLPSLAGPFLDFDDTILITQNDAVRDGASGLARIWKGQTLDYYPLTSTLFWLEWHLGGGYSVVFRIVSLLLHITAAALFAMLLSMWGIRYAWFIATVWALHPLNAASVAWISEQKNTLAAVLALGAGIAYTKSLRRETNQSQPAADLLFLLGIILFVLSLLAKAAFMPLPFVLLVMIWWRFGRVPKRDWVRLTPMFAIALASAIITIWFQWRHVAQVGNNAGPVLTRIARSGWIASFYLWKMVVPIGLSPIYARWVVNPRNLTHWVPVVALVVFIAFIAARGAGSAAQRGWRGLLALVTIWLLLLAPVLGFANLSFFRLSYVADHWTYPALMVFAVAIGWIVSRLPRRAQWPVMIGLVLALLPLTWMRAAAYHDTLALWEDSARKITTNYAIYNNLAWAYLDANRVDEGLAAARRAAALAPDDPDVQQTLKIAQRRLIARQAMHPTNE